jgi:hypothetical protein
VPGSIFKLHCHSCHAQYEIHTGASQCWNHGETWSYTNNWSASRAVCSSAAKRRIAVAAMTGDAIGAAATSSRGPDRVWHDRTPDGSADAALEGALPAAESDGAL